MQSEYVIRHGTRDDLNTVLTLNQAEAHWTSDLDLPGLKRLVDYSAVFDVICCNESVCGFTLVMSSTSDYPNANLAWFKERLSNFWYLDRIVVSSDEAGQGLGRRLYESCFRHARLANADAVTCEYSTKPMNTASASFHERIGFRQLGERADAQHHKTLSMQIYSL